jgi:hypothetical protein
MAGGKRGSIMRTISYLTFGILLLTAAGSDAQDVCHISVTAPTEGDLIFADGFECGNVESWNPDPATPRFWARSAEDLVFTISLNPDAIDGTTVVHLRVMLPSGHLYQEAAYPVATASARSESGTPAIERRVKGYPYPIRERLLTEVQGDRGLEERLAVAFPVGGTQIVRNSLYGKWNVFGFLGDADQPCGEAASFVISE